MADRGQSPGAWGARARRREVGAEEVESTCPDTPVKRFGREGKAKMGARVERRQQVKKGVFQGSKGLAHGRAGGQEPAGRERGRRHIQ